MTTPYVLAFAYCALLALKSSGAWLVVRRAERARATAPGTATDDVTILQPILGGDPLLEEILDRNVRALEDARFLWLIDDDDHVAREIAARSIARHPDRAIVVVPCPPAPDGVNPKTFKLALAAPDVSTRLCLVLDDDAFIDGAGLTDLIRALDDAHLATALPFHAPASSGCGRLLEQFVNNNAAMTYLPTLLVCDPISINGMCYAMRAETLAAIGGFAPLMDQLTDDLAVATAVREAGLTIAQTIAPVEVATTITSWRRYGRQMHRWFLFATLLFRAERPMVRMAIVVLHVVPPLLLIALVIATFVEPSLAALGSLAAVLVLRAALLTALQVRTTGGSRHRAWSSLLAELLQPFHLAHALADRTIHWRMRRYRVLGNRRFIDLER